MSYVATDLEELKKILADHEKRIKKLESSAKGSLLHKETKKEKNRPDLLVELKSEGFFKQPKFIGEIAEKCTEKGYHTSIYDLTRPLQTAVRSGVLKREKKDGKWAYLEK